VGSPQGTFSQNGKLISQVKYEQPRLTMSRAVASGGASGARPLHLKSVPSPFHLWASGCCIHPILYFKMVTPFWFLAPLLLNPIDGPDCEPCGLAQLVFSEFPHGTQLRSLLIHQNYRLFMQIWHWRHHQWCNWRGHRGWSTPGKLNVKRGPHLVCSRLIFFWFSIGCCFCVFKSIFRWYLVLV